jgi:hypothetical protein
MASGSRLHHFDFWPASSPQGYGDPPSAADSSLDWRTLAWDGQYLWVASEQQTKWGARITRMDVSNGWGVGSIPAQGIPLALASDGKWLWMATYDSGRGPAVLVRWKIPDAAPSDRRSYAAMTQTFAMIARLPGKEPAALAWDGEALWYADRQQKRLVRLQLP